MVLAANEHAIARVGCTLELEAQQWDLERVALEGERGSYVDSLRSFREDPRTTGK